MGLGDYGFGLGIEAWDSEMVVEGKGWPLWIRAKDSS